MTVRESVVFRGRRWVAGVLAAALVCAAATVAVARVSQTSVTTHHGKLGTMLAASNGRTLYLFGHDKGGKSSCYSSNSCSVVWPPLLTHGKPVAVKGSGVNPKLLGTTHRSNGTTQVTYNGHPLYEYSQDTKAGEMKGEALLEFGGHWYAVSTSGKSLKPPSVVWSPGGY